VLEGYVDGISFDRLLGWAYDAAHPGRRLSVDVFDGERFLLSASAGGYRADLALAGIGDAHHAFSVELPVELFDERPHRLRVRFGGTARELRNSPCDMAATAGWVAEFKLDPFNIESANGAPGRRRIRHLAVDINDTCNAACLYCPNPRSARRLDLDAFARFLGDKVEAVETVQLGCGQEPTADLRLVEFFRRLQCSPLQPRNVRMITNGVLLHRHDVRALHAAGLQTLAISVDSAHAETNDRLRPGAPLEHLVRNLTEVRRICPEIHVEFSIVVTALNVNDMVELVDFGVAHDVGMFFFREVTDHSGGAARQAGFAETFHALELREGQFARMQEEVLQAHGSRALVFLPRVSLAGWLSSAADGARAVLGPGG
jgi:molybdenum cofactor biosynthesis enzyme MoaA